MSKLWFVRGAVMKPVQSSRGCVRVTRTARSWRTSDRSWGSEGLGIARSAWPASRVRYGSWMLTRKTKKKTSFVPRALFRVAVTGAGVIPFCVTAGLTSLQPGCGGVANECYADVGCASVAEVCFSDAGKQVQCGLGVADVGFSDVKADHKGGPPFEGGVADIGFTDVKPPDALGVADIGFSDVADAHGPG